MEAFLIIRYYCQLKCHFFWEEFPDLPKLTWISFPCSTTDPSFSSTAVTLHSHCLLVMWLFH